MDGSRKNIATESAAWPGGTEMVAIVALQPHARNARTGIVKLTDCGLFLVFLHEAKPLKLRRAVIDNLPGFRSEFG